MRSATKSTRIAWRWSSPRGDREAQYIGQPNFPKNATAHLPGPLWAMLWLIPLRCGGGPESMIVFIALLNTMVIVLVYVLTRKVVGRPYALWAAMFYAILPWPVHSSVGCWNPQVMGVLGALLYLALWNVATRSHCPQIFWVVVVLAMMPHFHKFGAFLVPSALIVLGLRWNQVSRKWLMAGLFASVALYLPYVWGEAHNHWDNTRRMFGADEPFTFGCLKSLTVPVVALSSLMNSTLDYDFRSYMAFGSAAVGSFGVLGFFNLLSLVLGVLAVAGFLAALIRAMRGKWLSPRRAFDESAGLLFIAVVLILPLLAFIPTGHNFNSRYMVALYPLLAVLPALFVVNGPAHWRPLILLCTALSIGFNAMLIPIWFRYQGRLIVEAGYFVPTFRRMELVREKVAADAGRGVPIQIETSAYPMTARDKQATGVRMLAKYVAVCERFDPTLDRSRPVVQYRAEPAANLMDTKERVVYQGHGIALVGLVPRATAGSSEQQRRGRI